MKKIFTALLITAFMTISVNAEDKVKVTIKHSGGTQIHKPESVSFLDGSMVIEANEDNLRRFKEKRGKRGKKGPRGPKRPGRDDDSRSETPNAGDEVSAAELDDDISDDDDSSSEDNDARNFRITFSDVNPEALDGRQKSKKAVLVEELDLEGNAIGSESGELRTVERNRDGKPYTIKSRGKKRLGELVKTVSISVRSDDDDSSDDDDDSNSDDDDSSSETPIPVEPDGGNGSSDGSDNPLS